MPAKPTPAPRPAPTTAPGPDAADRTSRRVELVGAAMGMALLALTVAAAWTTQATAREATDTASAVRQSLQDATIDAAAAEAALEHAARLHQMAVVTTWLIPVLFLVGGAISLLRARVTGRYRRMLDGQRERAVHDSLHDALTGLPNRTLLAERFARALVAGRREGTRTALLLVDLDRFKEVNDTFGHQYGDLLLKQVGARLQAAVRGSDTVARLGGDEFAVLLPHVTGEPQAMSLAESLRRSLELPFRVEGVDLAVEASVGVVVDGAHGDDPGTLLQRADVAMYVAKSLADGVSAYRPAADEHSPRRLALLGDLRRAIEVRELFLDYQPKVDLATGALVGVEALVRWQHPTHGRLMPDQFIPLAEQTGLIGPLTSMVIEQALDQLRQWYDAGQEVSMAVNLSARNLLDRSLPDRLAAQLARHGIPPRLLELELTESAIMSESVRAEALLERLSTLGVRISIDDFGAGYTSLGQLKSLPVDQLKIDRSFVTTMVDDLDNAVIVHSVIDLGHNLGLTIVAEGVETESARLALAELGCDVAQGYWLGRPMPAAELTARLGHRPRVAATISSAADGQS